MATHALNDAVTDSAEVLVNTYTAGNQIQCSIAMDADGDFVVTWASEGQDSDGSWGIAAQRFNSMGEKVGSEFRVNTNTVNDQVWPTVAMDSNGEFIVVWGTSAQPYSYFNNIQGQMYDRDGNRIGGEFRVNQNNVPGTGVPPPALHPSVAMSEPKNTFVVSWTGLRPTHKRNGLRQPIRTSKAIALQLRLTSRGCSTLFLTPTAFKASSRSTSATTSSSPIRSTPHSSPPPPTMLSTPR